MIGYILTYNNYFILSFCHFIPYSELNDTFLTNCKLFNFVKGAKQLLGNNALYVGCKRYSAELS